MASLIALVCEAHRDAGGPFITLVHGLWAYCPAGYVERDEHRWRAIEPTSVESAPRPRHVRRAPSGAPTEYALTGIFL